MAKRLDERSYVVATGDASYRRNRVDLRKTQEMSQPDTGSVKRSEVNSGNDCQELQPTGQPTSMSPSRRQKSRSIQKTTAPSRSEQPELGPHTTPASQTSVSGPTDTRPRRGVREPAYLKDYIRNLTICPRSTNIESKGNIPRIRTGLESISLRNIFFLCFLKFKLSLYPSFFFVCFLFSSLLDMA